MKYGTIKTITDLLEDNGFLVLEAKKMLGEKDAKNGNLGNIKIIVSAKDTTANPCQDNQ